MKKNIPPSPTTQVPLAHLKKGQKKGDGKKKHGGVGMFDHYTYLGNFPPTPPLSQHFAPSDK